MREILRQIAKPLLEKLEQGDGEYIYKPSHRVILLVIGLLFFALGSIVLVLVTRFIDKTEIVAFLPVLVFYSVSLVCGIVGSVGSDRAVANIWRRGRP